jgi:lysozyme
MAGQAFVGKAWLERSGSMALKGIDVSKYQGVIDWGKVGKAGIQFAMVRASEGQSTRDSMFASNVAGAQRYGLAVGAYHYSYAGNVAQAQAEAKNFLAAVKGQKLTYPLVYDLENNAGTAKDSRIWSDLAVAFLRALESAGYFAMLYSNKYSLETIYDAARISPFAVWVADWAPRCAYQGPYGIWQTSDSGKVPGVAGAVDTDISYVDYAGIIRRAGLNHL